MWAFVVSILTAQAQPCPAATLAELQRPAAAEAPPYRLRCFATLPPGASVSRPILIEGGEAAGAGLDCRGGGLGVPGRPSDTRRPTVAIQSVWDGSSWSRPSGVRIADCTIHGNVRVWGMGAEGRIETLRRSSRALGHTERAQAAAPFDIRLEDVTFVGAGSIPLYVGPGVRRLSVVGGRFLGRSVSTAVYLDAESADNRIESVVFDIATGREQIAVDGSARNRIVGNRFELRGRGGVFLYRNCGEDGVVRHQTPSDNVIAENRFDGAAWLWPRAVVVGAREGRRSYCRADAGLPFGSSADDRDGAERNRVFGNMVRRRWLPSFGQAGRGADRTP